LSQQGESYSIAGNVAIVEQGDDQINQQIGIELLSCSGSNNANYIIPVNPSWVYSDIWTTCSAATMLSYLDIHYDVIHPWADNALFLNIGSHDPSWSYLNREAKYNCTAPATQNWNKWQYNITLFNGRPVNPRRDLVASDGCLGLSRPSGYIDAWSIWVYYNPPPHTPSSGNSCRGAELSISESDRDEYAPAIAFNSKRNEYRVVYESEGPGGIVDIYAQRVSSSGKLLSWIAVGTYPNSKIGPAVAYNRINDRYLVV
jgi:hypothetical protein